ncbi:MAG: VWA domain-containing protein, partial [Planctomycetota bacterium]|nr:VWA domain-containing protein [Planctomycetota bacterium]
LYPPDNELLETLVTTLAAWKDRKLIRDLIMAMANGDACYRAEFILRGLTPPVRDFDQVQRAATGDLKAEWAKHQREFAAWYASDAMATSQPASRPEYTARSKLIPDPEVIVDPAAPKWKKYLEVPILHLDQLGVNIVLDTTGSMGPAIEWIKGDLNRLMRVLRIIAREPTMGLTLYRDRGDAYLVNSIPMTGDVVALDKALKGVHARGGGDYPEALYEALYEAIKKQPWPRSPNAHKVLIVVTDAPPHKRDVPNIRKLLTASAEQGFRVHCLKVPTSDYDIAVAAAVAAKEDEPLSPDLALDAVAKWGKGDSCIVRFTKDTVAEMRPGESAWLGSVGSSGDESPYRQIIAAIVRGILRKEYHEQVEPFVSVLLETLAQSPPEKRVYLAAIKAKPSVPPGTSSQGKTAPPAPPPVYKQ